MEQGMDQEGQLGRGDGLYIFHRQPKSRGGWKLLRHRRTNQSIEMRVSADM